MAYWEWLEGSFAIYNPKTNCIYFRRGLFKVNDSHEILGWVGEE